MASLWVIYGEKQIFDKTSPKEFFDGFECEKVDLTADENVLSLFGALYTSYIPKWTHTLYTHTHTHTYTHIHSSD